MRDFTRAAAISPQVAFQPVVDRVDELTRTPEFNREEVMQRLAAQPLAVYEHVRAHLKNNGITDEMDALRVIDLTVNATERLRAQIENGENPIAPGMEDIKQALLREQRGWAGQNDNDPVLMAAAAETARYFQNDEQRRLANLRTNPGAVPVTSTAIAYEPTQANDAEMLDAAFASVPTFSAKGGPDRGGNSLA